MAALTSASITFTQGLATVSNFSRKSLVSTLAFGDGVATYPTGGIAISGSLFGMPNNIDVAEILDQGTSGYQFNWNSATGKLQMYYPTGSHGHSLFLKNAAQADAVNNSVNAAASNKLGANTGSDITIVASDGATNGGVVTLAGAVMSEIASTVAPAALTLVIRVSGW